MTQLPTVLLRHDLSTGAHYDWLLADPLDPAGLLWAGRVTRPSWSWAAIDTWHIQQIAPHRRLYLTYQGPLQPRHGQGRGYVCRVDQGYALPRLWTAQRRILTLKTRYFQGEIHFHRLDADRWQAWRPESPALDSSDTFLR
ncbi:MAG: hypothetical protein WD042_01890 [Phycisphaeraceae bacterium]